VFWVESKGVSWGNGGNLKARRCAPMLGFGIQEGKFKTQLQQCPQTLQFKFESPVSLTTKR